MDKYQSEVRFLILGSLAVLFLKASFSLLLVVLMAAGSTNYILLNGLVAVISAVQIFAIIKNKKWSWVLSLIQIGAVILASESTFGWFFSYIFKSFMPFEVFKVYVLSTLLVGTEILKTLWIYKKIG